MGEGDKTTATNVQVKRVDLDTFRVVLDGVKTLYAVPRNESAAAWIRPIAGGKKTVNAPALSSSVIVKEGLDGHWLEGALGFMNSNGNSVYKNGTDVYLLSCCSTQSVHGIGFSVCHDNFSKAMAVFAARRTIERTWLNWQDEYLVPHASDPASPLNAAYEQWVNDAVVYSLFNSKSNQSSLRGVQYKGKQWDILNEFFFMGHEEMQALADKAGFQEMYADTKAFGKSRFVHVALQGLALSDDAKAVLEAARSLVRASMAMRKAWHQDHPELHLQAWDAGWAQLKPMLKEAFKGPYRQFTDTYKAFERRMRKGVYEFGFLR